MAFLEKRFNFIHELFAYASILKVGINDEFPNVANTIFVRSPLTEPII